MSKFVKTLGVVALVAAITVVGLGAFAYYRTAAAADSRAAMLHGGGPGGGFGQAGLEAAAKALGMTVDDLTSRLRAGDTLADLAQEKGVDLQTVQDAVKAANVAAAKAAIEQAVTDGNMTRDKADWLLQGLDKGYWGPGADGFGFGMRGPRGFGGFGGPHDFGPRPGQGDRNAQPTATPSSSL